MPTQLFINRPNIRHKCVKTLREGYKNLKIVNFAKQGGGSVRDQSSPYH